MLRTKKALFSVYDKQHLSCFAGELIRLGWTIVASTGTATALELKGIAVSSLENLTGLGPILGHRVFSEHIRVAGALVSEASDQHDQERNDHEIPWFDMAVVDLYPLSEAIVHAQTESEVVDATDIGGVTLIRNAVKGRRIVLTMPEHRTVVLDHLKANGDVPEHVRRKLWTDAEEICARYCLASAEYIGKGLVDGIIGHKALDLKYGENPYQSNACLFAINDDNLGIHHFEQLAGPAPSFVNVTGMDCLLEVMTRISEVFKKNFDDRSPHIAIGSKHGIPVGASVDWTSGATAIRKMLWSNPGIIWGGEVAVNFEISESDADLLLSDKKREMLLGSSKWMLQVVMAPSFERDGLEMLAASGNRRIFSNPAIKEPAFPSSPLYRYVRGGFIRQPQANFVPDYEHLEWTREPLAGADLDTLLLVWAIAWSTHMNGVAIGQDRQLLVSDGQPSSERAVKNCLAYLADMKPKPDSLVFAANAFLPFVDAAELLINAGVVAGILPRGGIRENDIRSFFDRNNVTVAFVDEAYRGFSRH